MSWLMSPFSSIGTYQFYLHDDIDIFKRGKRKH